MYREGQREKEDMQALYILVVASDSDLKYKHIILFIMLRRSQLH